MTMNKLRLCRREFLGGTAAILTLPQSRGGFSGLGATSVSVRDFGARGDGVTDDAGAIQKALNFSSRIHFPSSHKGYAIKSNATIILREDTTISVNGQRLIFDGGTLTLKAERVGRSLTLSSPTDHRTRIVRLSQADGIKAGDLMVLSSSLRPSPDWLDIKQDCVPIETVGDGELRLLEALNFSYSPSDPGIDVLIYRPVRLELQNARIEFAAPDADRAPRAAFHLEGLRGVSILEPVIVGRRPFDRSLNIFRTGIKIYYSNNVDITSPYYEAMSYPVGAYGGTRYVFERNVSADYCHHSHADMGGWSGPYVLSGLVSRNAYQSLSTHPCFNAHASDFDCKNDFGLANWRCCGGSLRNGYIYSTVDDSSELPQFQNVTPAYGFEYIYEEADFSCIDVKFDMPNRKKMAPIYVKFGRDVKIDGVVALSCAVGVGGGAVESVDFGLRNQFGGSSDSAPSSQLVQASVVRGLVRQ